MRTDFSTPLEAALYYVSLSWAVLPLHSVTAGHCTCGRPDCPSPGKHPRTPRGVQDATTDADTVTGWWQQWPDANVGIALGPSGLAVVDLDERSGGFANLQQLPSLPDTLMSQTGNGIHLYYRAKGVRSKVLARGIDLKGDGSYVVAPPSLHRAGRRYQWLTDQEPIDLPPWVLSQPQERPTVEPGGAWVAELLSRHIEPGSRNTTLTRVVGYLRNVLPEPITLEIARLWNKQWPEPLPERELQGIVAGIYRRYPASYAEPEGWTDRTLLAANLPPPRHVVEGLLPEGLAILAGRPKRGKSLLALQLASDITRGKSLFGKVNPGPVIYLALEDGPRRLQQRLQAMGHEPTDLLHVYTSFPPLHTEGLAELCDLVEALGPVLVVVDTLSRAFLGLREQDRLEVMTERLAPIQNLALSRQITVLFIEHHKKPSLLNGNDVIDDIIGSTAKPAVADTILGLYRKSGEDKAYLRVTGRDVEEQELELAFDGLRHLWRPLGSAPELRYRQESSKVLAFLAQAGEADRLSISEATAIPERSLAEVLQRMVSEGHLASRVIRSTGRGRPKIVYYAEKGGDE